MIFAENAKIPPKGVCGGVCVPRVPLRKQVFSLHPGLFLFDPCRVMGGFIIQITGYLINNAFVTIFECHPPGWQAVASKIPPKGFVSGRVTHGFRKLHPWLQ
jgi:hypothetical protein